MEVIYFNHNGSEICKIWFIHGQYQRSDCIFQSSIVNYIAINFYGNTMGIFFIWHSLKDCWPIFAGFKWLIYFKITTLCLIVSTLISPIQSVNTNCNSMMLVHILKLIKHLTNPAVPPFGQNRIISGTGLGPIENEIDQRKVIELYSIFMLHNMFYFVNQRCQCSGNFGFQEILHKRFCTI